MRSRHTSARILGALRGGLGLKLAGLGMVLTLAATVVFALTAFAGGFTASVTILVDSPRSGLVLDPDAKVRLRGVEIGRVDEVIQRADGATLRLAVDPGQLRFVGSDAHVDIRSTTVFGAKYVNFVSPPGRPAEPLRPGTRITADRVTVELNTLFQHLSTLLAAIEPEKLNAILSALGTALDGRGEKLGDMLTGAGSYLRTLNPALPTLRDDLDKTAAVGELYADTAQDLLDTVANVTATARTLDEERSNLDELLVNMIGVATTAGTTLRDNENQLVTALDLLRPTTGLLSEYSPALYCLIVGVSKSLPAAEEVFGGNGPVMLSASFMPGTRRYTAPDDLPKVNATGGPHCAGVLDRVPGSNADYLVVDTSEGAPYVPNTTLTFNAPKVFQLLFAGLPGVS
ncbi:MCE family protein [Nocardia sp. NPDC055321]